MARTGTSRRVQAAQTLLSVVEIPDKLYFRIGEVSQLTQTKPYVLRYWETEFPMLRPVKSRSGHRLYRRQDVETIFNIKRLLYGHGFTIDGARKKLAEPRDEDHAARQQHLFRSPVDNTHLKMIQRELHGILTMLSRKC